MAELASLVVGTSSGAPVRYSLVYRGIDHRALKELSNDAAKSTLPQKYRHHLPRDLDTKLKDFAASVIDLQGKRHRADYDPLSSYRSADATIAIETARDAIRLFKQADEEQRKIFLTLLLCPIRA